MKTSSFKRTLAILLSVLLAMPLFLLSSFAEDVQFTQLETATDNCESGDVWYDLYALADATGNQDYKDSAVYLSEDNNTLKFDVRTSDDQIVTELHERDTDAMYFEYLRVVPAFGDPLPTSPDGLEDGAYWFDLPGLLSVLLTMELVDETELVAYANSNVRLSVDGTILRLTLYPSQQSDEHFYSDEFMDDPDGIMIGFLNQVGVDPFAGFTLLPTSEEGLEDGDYWFDAASLVNNLDETERQFFENADYYLSEDGNTLRFAGAFRYDVTRADSPEIFVYLRQVGVDPNAGFTLLPKSPDGLAFGDYWFDAAGIAADTGEEYYADADAYLNADGSVLRAVIMGQTFDFPKGEEDSEFVYGYLHEITTDAETGVTFTHLPKSPDGLAVGEYWYDAAGIADATGQSYLVDAEAYLSADGNLIRVLLAGETLDFPRDGEDGELVFSFLHQADGSTVDPNAGFALLPTSEDGLADGDYWYDIAGFAAYSGSSSYLDAQFYLKNDGSVLRMIYKDMVEDFPKEKDGSRYYYNFLIQVGHDPNEDEGFVRLPTTEDGLAQGDYWYDADALSVAVSMPYQNARFYLSADGTTLRMIFGDQTDFTRDNELSAVYFSYLRQCGVDPNAGFTLLPTSEAGLEDGAYWFDADGLNMLSANAFADAQFYLSDDGLTLRTIAAATKDYSQDSDTGEILFAFLRTVGVDPNAGFIQLPTSADGLDVGDLWYDAAAVAEAENDENYLHFTYYISEDGATLRVSAFGYPNDMTADSDDGAAFFAYLKRVEGESGTAYLTMNASAQTVRRGDTVTVTVDLAQNPGLAGMTLTLGYDADVLTLCDVQADGMFATGNLTLGGNYAVQPYNILWDDATSHETHTETGTILTLTFTVKNTAAEGETTVTLTYDAEGTFDVDLQSIPVIITNAVMTVDWHLPGDADLDGEVDLADVAVLTRYLAGGWDVTVNIDNCDVNGDHALDLKDVILIRRFLAGGWDVTLV